jgi:hypothetical protein
MSTRPPLEHVPPSELGRCCQCLELLDTRAAGVAQLVHGWRVNRAQGGANMIALAVPQGEFLCRHCLDKRRSGLAWDQLPLWED